MKQIFRLMAAIVLLLAVSATASADEKKAYVGFAAGLSRTNLKTADVDALLAGTGMNGITSVDDSDRGIKFYAGIAPARFLAFEAGYTDLGRFRFYSNRTTAGGGVFFGGDSTASSLDFSILGTLPIGESFALFARPGFGAWQVKVDTNRTVPGGAIATSSDESGVSPLLGLGATYRFAPHVSMRIELERHFGVGGEKTLGKQDIDLLSIAAQFHF
ncbi:MAG TPA: outer membrane beta-barrel protein [Burkholderiales bacterium]|nr:outer membrane beta-barrel protein [Burkholderiales bacterium]